MIFFKQTSNIEDLKEIADGRPTRAGKYWKGLSHFSLVEMLQREYEARHWVCFSIDYALSKDRNDVVGVCRMFLNGVRLHAGHELNLGFVNSNARRYATCFFVGVTDVKTLSGIITQQIDTMKKHTLNSNWAGEINCCMDEFERKSKHVYRTIERLKRCLLSEQWIGSILMDASRKKILPWTWLKKVDVEMQDPHALDLKGKRTAWALYNAFSYVIRTRAPFEQMDKLNRFKNLLPVFQKEGGGTDGSSTSGGDVPRC